MTIRGAAKTRRQGNCGDGKLIPRRTHLLIFALVVAPALASPAITDFSRDLGVPAEDYPDFPNGFADGEECLWLNGRCVIVVLGKDEGPEEAAASAADAAETPEDDDDVAKSKRNSQLQARYLFRSRRGEKTARSAGSSYLFRTRKSDTGGNYLFRTRKDANRYFFRTRKQSDGSKGNSKTAAERKHRSNDYLFRTRKDQGGRYLFRT